MTIKEFINFVLIRLSPSTNQRKFTSLALMPGGDATENSDIDFLIIKDSPEPKRQRALKFKKTLRGTNL